MKLFLDTNVLLRIFLEDNHQQLKLALAMYKQYKVKFTDCLIASQLPKNTILISFDEELPKIKEITVKDPKQVLS